MDWKSQLWIVYCTPYSLKHLKSPSTTGPPVAQWEPHLIVVPPSDGLQGVVFQCAPLGIAGFAAMVT